MEKETLFGIAYKALTGHEQHFPWQERAFDLLASGRIPGTVSLPTGTGKTSLITLWLIALAWQAAQGKLTLPRRLVWVVNRRVVVDQATDEAARMLERLTSPDSVEDEEGRKALLELKSHLAGISLFGSADRAPVAMSTLRGQLADNGDWKLDPSRPAVIIGTVDMIGSRLLFSGYGDGKYKRPLHAGLLGQDAWVVLDEAHLTPAFAQLLRSICAFQVDTGPSPLRVSLLSATQRGNFVGGEPISLLPEDEAHPVIGRRLAAWKRLCIHREKREYEVARLVELALTYRDSKVRVIVFLKSPENAVKASEHLIKATSAGQVKVLTGTMRGFERDKLVNDPVFSGFRANPNREPPEITHYLVATSAGEVGADLDADHLVCDLSTLDSLIQRFGRVNRLGMGEAWIDMVVPHEVDSKTAEGVTLAYLEGCLPCNEAGQDVSPQSLSSHPFPLAAFSASPPILPLAAQWLDMWSLTSIPSAAWAERPEVAPWLHGVVDDLPETWVVWRDDVAWLGESDRVREDECARVFDVYPILAQEQLREPTSRIRDKLRKFGKVRGNGCLPTIVLSPDGGIAWRGTLEDMVRDDTRGKIKLNYATVMISSQAGGLTGNGLFNPLSDQGSDVADQAQRRRRFLAQGDENGWEAFPGVQATDEAAYTAVNRRELVVSIARGEKLKLIGMVDLVEANDDEEGKEKQGRCLLYFAEAASAAQTKAISYVALQAQPLSDHNRRVGDMAEKLAERVGLNDLTKALGHSGCGHDTGKKRSCWQRAIGNSDPTIPLAKSGHDRFNLRQNGGYRHEFGSLLDAAQEYADGHPHRDLILHLIASHHGHARPHFKENGYDRESALRLCQENALETLQRFGKLQARYGWWGLAYLEALLKAADALVSAGYDKGDVL